MEAERQDWPTRGSVADQYECAPVRNTLCVYCVYGLMATHGMDAASRPPTRYGRGRFAICAGIGPIRACRWPCLLSASVNDTSALHCDGSAASRRASSLLIGAAQPKFAARLQCPHPGSAGCVCARRAAPATRPAQRLQRCAPASHMCLGCPIPRPLHLPILASPVTVSPRPPLYGHIQLRT